MSTNKRQRLGVDELLSRKQYYILNTFMYNGICLIAPGERAFNILCIMDSSISLDILHLEY